MTTNKTGIFRRISILVFSIIAILSTVFIIITYFASLQAYTGDGKNVFVFTLPLISP